MMIRLQDLLSGASGRLDRSVYGLDKSLKDVTKLQFEIILVFVRVLLWMRGYGDGIVDVTMGFRISLMDL
ncbi:hypothetical protein Tco_0663843 [Tanacetum coccineum]